MHTGRRNTKNMRKISLIILGLVALVRAFPNPQDDDLAILADIAGKTFKVLEIG